VFLIAEPSLTLRTGDFRKEKWESLFFLSPPDPTPEGKIEFLKVSKSSE
jgi:hypothetical protein